MTRVEKRALFWLLASIATSLAKSTGDKKYSNQAMLDIDRLLDSLGDYYDNLRRNNVPEL